MKRSAFIVAALALSFTGGAALASVEPDPLPRRLQFGVAVEAAEGGGVVIREVAPSLTAGQAGLVAGDVLVAVDGIPVDTPQALVEAGERRRAGDRLSLTVRREGRLVERSVEAAARPVESFSQARIELGSVAFRGGRLRTLMVRPQGWSDGPVLYYLQGHPCATVETSGPQDPVHGFIQQLLDDGIAVYRIEKPQVGDSLGGPSCAEGDFALELAGFEAGWQDLTRTHGVEPGRVFLFGHSMGGADAPLLAAAHREAPPAGVAVYGTLARNVHDYLFELLRLQGFLMTGEDPVSANASAEGARRVLTQVLLEDADPKVLAQTNPEADRILRDLLHWDGASSMLGHAVDYWRTLADQDLVAAWRDTRSSVLSLYGEADLTALNDEDAVTLVHIVNHYRPGSARYELIANADHLLSQAPSRAEAIGRPEANAPMLGLAPPRPLNPEIPRLVSEWIRQTVSETTSAVSGT